LDAPSPSYLEWRDSQTYKLRHLLKRAAGLGPRTSLVRFYEHLLKRFTAATEKSIGTEMSVAEEMIRTATHAYRPEKYEGEALLLLASGGPNHESFLPGWQALVPRNLHVRHVEAHHRDLLDAQNVRSVADAIVHFKSIADEES
jgi:hypothetical protein